ncbi:MAG: DUF5711 family protein [Oscillospiraceae bacterium]|nr:DUF5711 family protein [Oscillospiraceae bacterium]
MDENPKKTKDKKRKLIRIAGSVLSLAILTYIAIALISGRQTGLFSFFKIFSRQAPVEYSDEYSFDVGRSKVFAYFDGAVASAGTLGIQVLDASGGETLRDSFRMACPSICASNDSAIAYDIGATAVRVFNKSEIISSFETQGSIISASLNRNGWFAVSIQGSGATAAVVTVYNNKGKEVYRVHMASGYILSAELSPDNKSLAILNIAGSGSRVTYYNLNSVDPDKVVDFENELLISIRYMENGEVYAVSTQSIYTIKKNGECTQLHSFDGKRLGGFILDDFCVVLYLLDYGVGHRGRLVSVKSDGSIIAEAESDKEVISMSYRDDCLAVLRNDRLTLYDINFAELPMQKASAPAVGATYALALSGGAALAAGDHAAVVYKAG